jgi:hypothetical protein
MSLKVVPNPAVYDSRICFTLPVPGNWMMELLDARGSRINGLNRKFDGGTYQLPLKELKGNNRLPAGVYCIRMTIANGMSMTCKMIFAGE